MSNILHMTKQDAAELVVEIREHLPMKRKSHAFPKFWQFIREVEGAFGLTWREDKRHFLEPEPIT